VDAAIILKRVELGLQHRLGVQINFQLRIPSDRSCGVGLLWVGDPIRRKVHSKNVGAFFATKVDCEAIFNRLLKEMQNAFLW